MSSLRRNRVWHALRAQPISAAWLNLFFEFIALAGILGAISFALVLMTHPTRVILTARSNANEMMRLVYTPETTYIPYYVFKPFRLRSHKGKEFESLEFILPNDTTRELRLELGKKKKRIEIFSLTLDGLILHHTFSASEIPQSFEIHNAAQNFQDDVLILDTTRGTAALQALPSALEQIQTLATREQQIPLLLLFISIVALGLRYRGAAIRVWNAPRVPIPSIAFSKSNLATIVILALLLYASARVFQLVLHDPMIGLQNNGDFYRMQACLGWEAFVPRDANGNEIMTLPVTHYRVTAVPVRGNCYLSSEALLMMLARDVGNSVGLVVNGNLDVRVLGAVNGILLLATGWFVTWLFARAARFLGIVSALIFAVLIADPMHTIFFNTLFSEVAVFISAYLVFSLAIYLVVTRRWNSALGIAMAIAMFILALSKVQEMLLGAVLLAAMLFVMWRVGDLRNAPRATWTSLIWMSCAAIAGLGIQLYQVNQPGLMRLTVLVNRFDTYFGAVLPEMSEPRVGLKMLGVPETCAAEVGKTWYSSAKPWGECTMALAQATVVRGIMLFLYEPALVPRILDTAIPQTYKWLPLDARAVPKSTLEQRAFSPFWSIAWFVDALKSAQYAVLFFALALAGIGALLILTFANIFPIPLVRCAGAQFLLTILAVYALGTSVMGDGYIDFAKHTFLVRAPLVLSMVFLPAMMVWAVRALKHRIMQKPFASARTVST